MALKSQQLQAFFARRREIEHTRIQRTEALNRYYDHWGKVTTRFSNWTTPEYYKQADEQLKQKKDKKEKEQQLTARRDRLRKLFADEKDVYELEQRERARPKARKIPADTETLARIDQSVKERENIKRKLALEAKLYGKWRHGVDDENLIFDSKTDNQVLAKLNWLDKQVDEQLQREKEEAIAQERNLRLQEEISKTEQAQKERQQIREKEIKEIRALQERHMDELQKRQRESDLLRDEEKELRVFIEELSKELELLDESSAMVLEPSEVSQAYNLNKIKIFIRKRSEVFRNQIKLSISILERIYAFVIKPAAVKTLLEKYKEQLEAEGHTLSQIEAMYESEAKFSLQRCEEMWQAQHLQRYHEIKQLLKDEQCALADKLNANLQRQDDVIEIRSTHLTAIENSNDQLKQLIQEQEQSPRYQCAESPSEETVAAGGDASSEAGAAAATPRSINAKESKDSNVSSGNTISRGLPPLRSGRAIPSQSTLSKLSNSFTNLNLDVWEDLKSARGGIDSPRLQSTRSMQVVTPANVERPKFARKRVAWT